MRPSPRNGESGQGWDAAVAAFLRSKVLFASDTAMRHVSAADKKRYALYWKVGALDLVRVSAGTGKKGDHVSAAYSLGN